jgi:hypothetical protein
MSYTVSFFLINNARLQKVIGCKDLSIIDKLDLDDYEIDNTIIFFKINPISLTYSLHRRFLG